MAPQLLVAASPPEASTGPTGLQLGEMGSSRGSQSVRNVHQG